MPGAGGHRIIDGRDGERAHRVSVLLDGIHLGDFFIQRAACQRHSEDALFEFAGLFLQAGRATVLALVMALDAVVGLIERLGQAHSGIGELETFTVTQVMRGENKFVGAMDVNRLHRNQMLHVQFVRHLEQHAMMMFLAAGMR